MYMNLVFGLHKQTVFCPPHNGAIGSSWARHIYSFSTSIEVVLMGDLVAYRVQVFCHSTGYLLGEAGALWPNG